MDHLPVAMIGTLFAFFTYVLVVTLGAGGLLCLRREQRRPYDWQRDGECGR